MKIRILFITSVIVWLSGCQRSEEQDALNIALAKQSSSALAFIALDQGFFKQQGLNLTATNFPSGKQAIDDGYLGGGFDMVITTDVSFSKVIQTRPDLVIFGHIFSANNVNRIIARKDVEIKQLSDLKGHKLATQKDSAVHFFTHRVMNAYEIDADDIDLQFLIPAELPEALAKGQIDAFSMHEPYISQATILLNGQVNVFSALGLYNQYEVLIAERNLLKNKARAFEKFLKAILQAQDFAFRSPDKASEIMAKVLHIDVKKMRQNWRSNTFQVGLQQGLLVTLEEELAWLKQDTPDQAFPNVMNHLYFATMQSVAPELISIVRLNHE